MKKILLMAFVAVFAVACSSKGTHIGGPYLRYVKSDLAGKTTCEVRDSVTKEVVVSAKDGFTNVVFHQNVFLAAKDGVWGLYTYRDKHFNPLLEGKTFTTYAPGKYLQLVANEGRYLYLGKNTIGPARTFELEEAYNLIFASDGQKWTVYELSNGKKVIPAAYENLVCAVNEKGETAFYSGNQKIQPDGSLAPALKSWIFATMKKEAAKNETPWPEKGYGIVKVKTLR